jgi:hypothetical protein
MARMIVLADRMEYGTRALRAGQAFDTLSDSDAYWLELIGKARPVASEAAPEDPELERWRRYYFAAHQKPCDRRWGIARIRKELEAEE